MDAVLYTNKMGKYMRRNKNKKISYRLNLNAKKKKYQVVEHLYLNIDIRFNFMFIIDYLLRLSNAFILVFNYF